LAVIFVAGVGIFYACKKDVSAKELTKEAKFVAKINKETCVLVTIYRDEKNNAHFVTKNTANDPNLPMGIIISNALKINSQKTRNGEEEDFIELSNDAIYWVVPLDGNEPEKIDPDLVESGGAFGRVSCTCAQGKTGCYNTGLSCPAPVKMQTSVGVFYRCPSPGSDSCCKTCNLTTLIGAGGSTPLFSVIGSSYIVQSNTITVNGITYE